MDCKKCGNSIPDGLSACPHCGAPVEEDDVLTKALPEEEPTVAVADDEATQAVLPTEASVFQPQPNEPLQQEDPMAQNAGTVTPPKKTGGSGKAIAIIIIAVIFVAAIAVGAYFGLKGKNKDDDGETTSASDVQEDSTDPSEQKGEDDKTEPSKDTQPTDPTDADDTTEAPSEKDPTEKTPSEKETEKDDPTESTEKTKPTDATKPTEAKTDVSDYRISRYKDLFASKKFLMDMSVQDDGADISGPVKLATKNDNVYISASMEGMEAVIIYQADKNKSYMLLPQMKFYTEMTDDLMGGESIKDMFDIDELTGGLNQEMEDVDITTSTKKVDGKNLYCETVKSKDGLITNYYFDGEDLVLIENLDGHESQSVMKINQLTDNVPDSLFEVPKGYVYMDLNALGGLMG